MAGTRLSAPSSPNSPPLLARVATLAELPPTSRPTVTTPRHKDSRVFACHLESSHQLQCTVASHHRCSPASVLVGTALVKLPLPNVCRGGHCLALPARVRSRVDRVYWHSPSYRVAHLGFDASSTSPPPAAKGQRHVHIASTQGYRSSHSLRHLCPCMHTLMIGRSRAIPSTPSTLCPHGYKRDHTCAFCPRHRFPVRR
jgi:hypothetical protein